MLKWLNLNSVNNYQVGMIRTNLIYIEVDLYSAMIFIHDMQSYL